MKKFCLKLKKAAPELGLKCDEILIESNNNMKKGISLIEINNETDEEHENEFKRIIGVEKIDKQTIEELNN